jgi:hypothetical protein
MMTLLHQNKHIFSAKNIDEICQLVRKKWLHLSVSCLYNLYSNWYLWPWGLGGVRGFVSPISKLEDVMLQVNNF